MTTARISRNDPCPCGSGKKYKKCCLSSSKSTPRFSWPSATEPAAPTLRPTSFPRTTVRSSDSAKKWNEVVFDAPLNDGGRLHAVLLYSDGGLNRKGEIVTLDLPDVGFRGLATVVSVQRSSAKGDVEAEVVRVVHFRDYDDLGQVLYGEWKPPQDFLERWAGQRRAIGMRMDFPDGRWCDIQLLRTIKWMEQNGVHVGGAVFLDLTDVGVRGWANVLDILPCPIPEEFGDGEMVTGTFKYSHGRVGELVLQSEPKPIGVTPSHLFWSEDRQDWAPVSELRPGENVKTLNGLTRVVSFTMTNRVEPVYNIEVANDHCYRVGECGVLVHNQSALCDCEIGFSMSGPNPNNLSVTKVSGLPTSGEGVYVKKHFGKKKAGKASDFRTRYTLSNPEGGCNIWYEMSRTRSAAPDGLSSTDRAYWTASRQRRFDEAYVDGLIPESERFTADNPRRPVDATLWSTKRHIFGYGDISENWVV